MMVLAYVGLCGSRYIVDIRSACWCVHDVAWAWCVRDTDDDKDASGRAGCARARARACGYSGYPGVLLAARLINTYPTLCLRPMPTGPWTVPTPLTTPELGYYHRYCRYRRHYHHHYHLHHCRLWYHHRRSCHPYSTNSDSGCGSSGALAPTLLAPTDTPLTPTQFTSRPP